MKLSQQEKEYLVSKKITLWLKEYQIKNEQGEPVDFRNHLFQYDMFLDMSPKQVVQKTAQVGISQMNILKTQYVARYKGMDVIYTLPTFDDVRQFVGGKVNRIIANNPIIQEWTKDKDSIDQKRVGNNVIYYRGTWTEKAAMMVTSDLNVYDEVDASKQDVIEQYSTRLQHSKYGWEWWFSHPSVEGSGVNKLFAISDQKHWFHKCSRCNNYLTLKWPENVDVERKIFICTNCKQELREEDRRKGIWVRKYKNREISGYQVSSLFCPWISAARIIEYYKDKSEEYFYNKVLGLPYIGKDTVVTEQTILKNCKEEKNSKTKRIVIGCDTGLTQYYVVGNEDGMFFYGKSSGYEDVEKLLNHFKNSILVMDAKGDLTQPRELQKKYPGRVFLCEYRLDRKTLQFVSWGKDREFGSVIADRNRMIQYVIEEFSKGEITLNGKQEEWEEYFDHWRNIYREEEMDNLDLPRRIWKRRGADHWVHATVYWRVGMSKYAQEPKIISPYIDLQNNLISRKAVTVIDEKVIVEKKGKEWRIL